MRFQIFGEEGCSFFGMRSRDLNRGYARFWEQKQFSGYSLAFPMRRSRRALSEKRVSRSNLGCRPTDSNKFHKRARGKRDRRQAAEATAGKPESTTERAEKRRFGRENKPKVGC